MITFKKMDFFDNKYVVIGQLVDGDDTLAKMEEVSTTYEKPVVDIEIADVCVHEH